MDTPSIPAQVRTRFCPSPTGTPHVGLISVTDVILRFGHLSLVRGEGNKKLSKRDPESNLLGLKKAEAINTEHIRALSESDFDNRIAPYLVSAGLFPEKLSKSATENGLGRCVTDSGAHSIPFRRARDGELLVYLG